MTQTGTVENEAELQARLEGRLRAALPLLPGQIRLERYLRLLIGHHAITVDGLSPTATGVAGRYDVLVMYGDKPLLLAELKSPGTVVDQASIAQALSYARVHDPIVPLVLVTNGDTTLLRRTYDGAELDLASVAAHRLTETLVAASSVAASDSDDAIRTLLGASRETWTGIFSKWSGDVKDDLTGSVDDFGCPLVRELSFTRDAATEVVRAITDSARVVVIHGPPLVGITNVLSQISSDSCLNPCLFIQASETSDILQFVADRLSRELSFRVSKDDLRGWLNTRRGLMGISLVLDGIPVNGMDELVEYASAGLMRLVIGMNSELLDRLSTVAGRNQLSRLAKVATQIELQQLSDHEFARALDALHANYDTEFFNGAQHVPQLRWPRALRVIAATLPSGSGADSPQVAAGMTRMLPAIPDPTFLQRCSDAFESKQELKFDLRMLARAYLKGVKQHWRNPDWLVETWGRPSLDPTIVEKELGPVRVERLRSYGFISWVETKKFGPRLLVRLEELLGHHIADEWSEDLAAPLSSTEFGEILDRLLTLGTVMLGADVVIAAAIMRASEKNERLLSTSIDMLRERTPTISRLQEGALVELLVKDGRIRLKFGSGMDEEVTTDMLPWLVLSHLSRFAIGIDRAPTMANVPIFLELGTWPHQLYWPPPAELADLRPMHVHELPGIGSVLCISTGIVEPLLQSMLFHTFDYPQDLINMARAAFDKQSAHLVWRVLTVAHVARNCADPAVAAASHDATEILEPFWTKLLERVECNPDDEDAV